MIKKIKSDRANWLISSIVGDEGILKTNPIIAGGCALSVYRAIRLHDSDSKWDEFKRCIEKGAKSAKIDKFGDIDIWYLEGNDIHTEDNLYNWMVSTETKYDTDVSRFNTSLLNVFKVSAWANSFRQKNADSYQIVQFIKKKPDSVESLLDSFDFTNCSVAWSDGFLYYDEDLDDAFKSFELRIKNSSPYTSDSISMKVFNALRAFKYSKRYSLDFCKELTEHIFNLYASVSNIDYDKYKNGIVEIESLYGKKIASVDILRSMVEQFKQDFIDFSKMKFFKKEYAIYLIDQSRSLEGLEDIIKGSGRDLKPPSGIQQYNTKGCLVACLPTSK